MCVDCVDYGVCVGVQMGANGCKYNNIIIITDFA